MNLLKVTVAKMFAQKEEALILKYINLLESKNIAIADYDFSRPWGGFILIEENVAKRFAKMFFTGMDLEEHIFSHKLSPKLLFVKPKARLSWQYHNRRSEIWQVLQGPVGIVRSVTDKEAPLKNYQVGDRIALAQGERHRLIGTTNLGVVAEFWLHSQDDFPSDEEDIVRLQDDFSRK